MIMHCPTCRDTFRVGFLRCPTCSVPLLSGAPPAARVEYTADEAEARLAASPIAVFATLPQAEAVRLRDQLLDSQIDAALVPAGSGGCGGGSSCATEFSLVVHEAELPGLRERYQQAYEKYAAAHGMVTRDEPEDSCVCCGNPVSSLDAECRECGIALL
jgi:hypothetical protein